MAGKAPDGGGGGVGEVLTGANPGSSVSVGVAGSDPGWGTCKFSVHPQ